MLQRLSLGFSFDVERQFLVKNWLVDAEKTEVAHLWAAVNVWLEYQSCLLVEFKNPTVEHGRAGYHAQLCRVMQQATLNVLWAGLIITSVLFCNSNKQQTWRISTKDVLRTGDLCIV